MEPTTQALLDSCKELLAIIVSRHGSLYSEAQGRAEEAISAAEGPRGMLVHQTIPGPGAQRDEVDRHPAGDEVASRCLLTQRKPCTIHLETGTYEKPERTFCVAGSMRSC